MNPYQVKNPHFKNKINHNFHELPINTDDFMKCGKTEIDNEGNKYIIWRYHMKGKSYESESDYGANGITGCDSIKARYR